MSSFDVEFQSEKSIDVDVTCQCGNDVKIVSVNYVERQAWNELAIEVSQCASCEKGGEE